MEFGIDYGYGKPLYLNGHIAGWVCESINGWYTISLARCKCDHSGYFKTEHEADLALLKIFGE